MVKKITQPIKKHSSQSTKPNKRRKTVKIVSSKRIFQQSKAYGTSKLETYFAKNFLNKFGVRYVYEYEAKDIGRFYDFAIVAISEDSDVVIEEKNGIASISQQYNDVRPCLIIEVDGSYFHSDPRLVEEYEMNAMQKRNRIIDEYKDDWCRVHHIPILRIWEYDIRNNPDFVMEQIRDSLNRLDLTDKIKIKKKKKFLNKSLKINKNKVK